MKKASISVYLSLILMILLSLFLTCIEGARIEATKLKFAYAADAAITSCFSEYRKELFEKYDLLFLDVAYGGCFQDLKNAEERLNNNFSENCTPGMGNPLFLRKSMLIFEETDVEIEKIQIATDEEGEIFKEAAISYVESKIGSMELEMFLNETKEYEDAGYFSTGVQTERTKNEALIEETAVVPVEDNEEEKAEAEDIIWEPIEVDNPADQVNQTRKGVLNLVVEDINELSTHTVNLSSYASQRENGVGARIELSENNIELEDLFFVEYILEKSGDYIKPEESKFLNYGCEYVIAGKDSDVENLRNVVNRILLIRETANVAHILADADKMQELEVLAAGLSAVITLPELQPIIKYSLVLAWGYAEAVSDVKRLLNGEKVAFYKTKDQWKLSLENMLCMNLQENEGSENTEEGGITYQQYLRMLLYIEPSKQKIARMMDVVEMGIRSLGYEKFRLDLCVNAMEVKFIAMDRNGKTYEKKKQQTY